MIVEKKNLTSEKNLRDTRSDEHVVDFYMENGFVVFTEAYHLKRGNCCKSGCRHCPYGYRKKP
jgi:predicted GNAT family N-acyltransferase